MARAKLGTAPSKRTYGNTKRELTLPFPLLPTHTLGLGEKALVSPTNRQGVHTWATTKRLPDITITTGTRTYT